MTGPGVELKAILAEHGVITTPRDYVTIVAEMREVAKEKRRVGQISQKARADLDESGFAMDRIEGRMTQLYNELMSSIRISLD